MLDRFAIGRLRKQLRNERQWGTRQKTVVLRLDNRRSADSHHPMGIVAATAERTTQYSHLLRFEGPHPLTFINRIDAGDVGTDKTCRMRAIKEMNLGTLDMC